MENNKVLPLTLLVGFTLQQREEIQFKYLPTDRCIKTYPEFPEGKFPNDNQNNIHKVIIHSGLDYVKAYTYWTCLLPNYNITFFRFDFEKGFYDEIDTLHLFQLKTKAIDMDILHIFNIPNRQELEYKKLHKL